MLSIVAAYLYCLQFYWWITEVVEHCCSITSLQLGETLPGIAKDMDTMTFRVPLGVTAGITPFNFPAMIPLWVRNEPTLYLTPNVCFLRWAHNCGCSLSVGLIFCTCRCSPWPSSLETPVWWSRLSVTQGPAWCWWSWPKRLDSPMEWSMLSTANMTVKLTFYHS